MRKLRMSELNRLSTKDYQQSVKHPFVIALDNVRSTLNVGSVFRTADAFKCSEILLGELCPEPNKEMNKTALGATDSVDWVKSADLHSSLSKLKSHGYQLWAIEQTTGAESLLTWQIPPEAPVVFIFGNEVTGVSDEILKICTGAIEIPQYGTKHSLNISVSAGVVLWDYLKQLKTKKAR